MTKTLWVANCFQEVKLWGAWVSQSVKRPTGAQVMISQFMGSSPTWVSVLTAQSLEPAPDSVSSSLSVPLLFMLCLHLSKINKCLKKKRSETSCTGTRNNALSTGLAREQPLTVCELLLPYVRLFIPPSVEKQNMSRRQRRWKVGRF